MAEKFTGEVLKVLRTDNGGEYTSTEFQNYLKKEGIRHELTVPKTPEQNGVAERMNRTLIEAVRSMLAQAKLPPKFWAETVATATYLGNRSPTTAVAKMTPYEDLTGKKPCVEHLRVFGCAAYAHIPKDERQKLDVKAKECVLLGYGTETKGYRLYDIQRQKVIYSHDVLFDESRRGIQEEPEAKNGDKYIELDSTSNEGGTEEIMTDKVQGPEQRRPTRKRQPPHHYGEWVSLSREEVKEPLTTKEALSSAESSKWSEAMHKELKSLKDNDVWELVELPENKKAVGCRWLYKVKVAADGRNEGYKARLVAQGYAQQRGQDHRRMRRGGGRGAAAILPLHIKVRGAMAPLAPWLLRPCLTTRANGEKMQYQTKLP